jgi:hypothetical protein
MIYTDPMPFGSVDAITYMSETFKSLIFAVVMQLLNALTVLLHSQQDPEYLFYKCCIWYLYLFTLI